MRRLPQLRRLALVGLPVVLLGTGDAVPSKSDLPDRRPSTAAVEGRIEISKGLTTRRPRFRIYAEPGAGAVRPAPDPHQEEWRNVVVYVERVPPPAGTGTAERAILRQRDERFFPHVLPIVRGMTVEFPNDDELFHNVFSLSRTKEFDLGRYPRGVSREVTFDRTGIVQVFCHIHSDMSAVILVLDNGFFAVPDSAGRYAIPDLPAGEYTLVAWHERIRPITHHLRVEPGQLVRVDFTIPLPAADAARAR